MFVEGSGCFGVLPKYNAKYILFGGELLCVGN
jgi:hypothetical protein